MIKGSCQSANNRLGAGEPTGTVCNSGLRPMHLAEAKSFRHGVAFSGIDSDPDRSPLAHELVDPGHDAR